MTEPSRLTQLKDGGSTSPYFGLLGIEVAELGKGWAELRMKVDPRKHHHGGGVVQGGAIATIADASVAYALMTTTAPEQTVVTVEIKLNYLAPVKDGLLTSRAQIVHRGRRIALGEMEVRNDGNLVAKGLATFMIVDRVEAPASS